MRRSWLVVAFVAALGGACTLIEQPTSYFDPQQGQGTLVTLGAVTAEAVRGLALTTNAVVYGTGDTVFRVPKSGGDVETIATFDAGDLVALTSDGTNRVAWCSTSVGITVWDDRTSTSTSIPGSETCDTLAISEDRLVYTIATMTTRAIFYQSSDGAASPAGGFVLDPNNPFRTALALTNDDVYYATQENALAREVFGSDVEAGIDASLLGAPSCYIATGGSDPSAIFVTNSGDAEVALLASSDTDILSVTNASRCCDRAAMTGPTACPTMIHWVAAYAGRLALEADSGTTWAISENAMASFEPADLFGADSGLLGTIEDANSSLREGYSSPTNLAVDGTYAFFTNYNPTSRLVQVQRLKLTP